MGIFGGVLGIAWAYVAAVWLTCVPMFVYCSHGTALRLVDLFGACVLPFVASLLAGVVVYFCNKSVELPATISVLSKGIFITGVVFVSSFFHLRTRRLIVAFWLRVLAKKTLS